ncbi:Protein-lysine N-methyltransferase EFM3 [Sparassis crispa]|uniref:Protein-lysine N-methyltransferase EFM3 n=1 Tax=Sparassis crispa TaxID=139825 RepID=A0A401G5X7_9APHY|nr:Protein-lysine N-methyltransferase EFM3 [Sparassis crispa]GBE77547.1 Protein-lysine N-methyltransferase EFM3 [Sparassis crispa]
MHFPSNSPFTEVHGFFLECVLLNLHLRRYPPARQYQYSFWKWAIRHLEELVVGEDAEIDPRIYSHLISVMPQSIPGNIGFPPPSETYATYFWKSEGIPHGATALDRVTVLESRTVIESGTTGLRTWLASYVLAHYLILHRALVQGRRVLELGSGTGLLGLVIAALQQHPGQRELAPPSTLWLTDVNSAVLQRCQDNIRLPCNSSSRHPNLKCRLLDWTDAVDPLTRPSVQTSLAEMDLDVVAGADLVYDPSIIPALLETLHLALESRSTPPPAPQSRAVAFVALTVRNKETFARFSRAAGDMFLVEELDNGLNGADVFLHGPELDAL